MIAQFCLLIGISFVQVLLRRFQITHNLSLDGVLDILNSKNMTEAGPLDLSLKCQALHLMRDCELSGNVWLKLMVHLP